MTIITFNNYQLTAESSEPLHTDAPTNTQESKMKFENYSIVKCPMGISIKPNNGYSDLEVTLIIENGTLCVTLHAPRPKTIDPSGGDWCEPVGEIKHPMKYDEVQKNYY